MRVVKINHNKKKSELKKEYTGFNKQGNKILANHVGAGESSEKLAAGNYQLRHDGRGTWWFEEFDSKSDRIMDLPSPEYFQVVRQMEQFLDPKIQNEMRDFGYIVKRSALLYGAPGTGKTIITNRIAQKVIEGGGIVLFLKTLGLIGYAYDALNSTQPDTLVLVVLEEFERLALNEEQQLLSLLDGQVQKDNVIYLATTNYIERVPKRLYRPGRFSQVVEVKYPTIEARLAYFQEKLGATFPKLKEWVKKTDGLSIDELKEIVLSVHIFKNDLDITIARILETRGLDEATQDNYNDDDDDDGYSL